MYTCIHVYMDTHKKWTSDGVHTDTQTIHTYTHTYIHKHRMVTCFGRSTTCMQMPKEHTHTYIHTYTYRKGTCYGRSTACVWIPDAYMYTYTHTYHTYVQEGDVLRQINGVCVDTLSVPKALAMMRGEVGEYVHITALRKVCACVCMYECMCI
jgi:hypothetical protein